MKGVDVAGRNVLSMQSALKLAGERRRELDRARGERDRRIVAAAAATLVALEVRDDAVRALEAAQAEVGFWVRKILSEGVGVDKAAALLDLDPAEVRRLVKAVPAGAATAGGSRRAGSVPPLPDAGGSDGVARGAG